MERIFSTFITGFGDVVLENLRRDLDSFREKLVFDGLVVYETSSQPDEIKRLNYLNNSFLLLKEVNRQTKITDLIELFIKEREDVRRELVRIEGTVRPVFSNESRLVAINSGLEQRLLTLLEKDFHLAIDLTNPETELWFVSRREGWSGIGLRITKHPDYKDVLMPGELRPELTNLLCLLSEPKESDVFLDPFAGRGTIPNARKNYPGREIIAGDLQPGSNEVTRVDALNMGQVSDSSVDKIVTDPPWGIYVKPEVNLEDFYLRMLREFYRVLTEGGTAILLMGNKETFDKVLKKFSDKFKLSQKLDVLVSGKKARVYKLTKITQ